MLSIGTRISSKIGIHAVMLGVVYWLAVVLSVKVVSPADHVALFWPPNAIAAAVLIFNRSRHWPIFLTAMAVGFLAARLPGGDLPLIVVLAFCLANLIEVWLVAVIVRNRAPGPLAKDALPRVLNVAVLASILASFVSAIVGSSIVFVAIADANFLESAIGWFTGDLSGLLLVLPLLLAWRAGGNVVGKSKFFLGKFETSVIVAMFIIIAILTPLYLARSFNITIIFPYLVYPVLIWSAFRTGLRGATLSIFCVGLFSIGQTYAGNGLFVFEGMSANGQVILMKTGLIAISATTILLATLVADRAMTAARLGEATARTDFLLTFMGEAIYGLDLNGNCTFCNPACVNLLGYESDADLLGKNVHELVHHSHADGEVYPAKTCVIYKALMANESCHRDDEVFWRADGTSFATEYRSHPVIVNGKPAGSVVTFTDITMRKQHIAEIIEARREAERASRSKSDFLSSISHELRTPLNAILGFAEILGENSKGNLSPSQITSARHIQDSGKHLLSLVDNVLDLAQLEGGAPSVNVGKVKPGEIVKQCVSVARELCKQEALVFRDEITSWHLPEISADETRFQQALLNLISNAVKYNSRGGVVTIGVVELERGWIRFLVSDTGIGIADHNRKSIFTPFSRLGLESSNIAGTGIGLTITREVVNAMGGRIGFESKLKEGSSFWIELPVISGRLEEKTPGLVSSANIASAD